MSLILSTTDDHIGNITLNNTAKRNALGEDLVNEVIQCLARFKDEEVRVVLLRAPPGSKVWSAGHDVNELPLARRDPLGWNDPLRILIRELETFPAPIVALIEGSVWGGACEVVFACDMVIASQDATLAVTPAKLGVPYNITGVLNFMNAASRAIVREMAFTAQPMKAERAERLGIINYVVPANELGSFALQLAEQIKRNAPLSIAVIKEQLRLLESAHTITPRMFERIQGLRRAVYDSEDYHEGVTAFLEKRKPNFTGH